MKPCIFILLICTLSMLNLYQHASYQEVIQKNALIWEKTYIHTFTNSEHIKTFIEIILLSYQLAQESCNMIIAKLIMQEELLKIYTPSLIDSWQTNMQVLHNDTNKLEQALDTIKISQLHFKELLEKIKLIANKVLQIDPQPTQILINDLKQGLLAWTQEQSATKSEIDLIQQEFLTAITTITDLKNIFSNNFKQTDVQNNQLKQAAGFVSKSYKDIESVFDHFTKLRKISMYEINDFFKYFFNTYYSIIYQIAKNNDYTNFTQELPQPDELFEN